MRRPLIIANWKANPKTVRRAVALARAVHSEISKYRNVELVVAPPFPFLIPVKGAIRRAALGAQNAFWETHGPYTGEVGTAELKNLGVRYVILGHSERRINLHETDEMVNRKVRAVLAAGMTPVICVGERHREGGEIPSIVGEQVRAALAGVKAKDAGRVVVAYEPVWAVSTQPGAHPDTPESAFRAAVYIRKIAAAALGRAAGTQIRVIYGGSVTDENIASFLHEGRMQGALVGGASIDAKKFASLFRAVSRLKYRE